MAEVRFQIGATQLIKLIGSVVKLASVDSTLPRINAVLLQRQGDYLTATATDRYVIGVARDHLNPSLDAPPGGWRFSIPLDRARALLKLARASVKPIPVMPFEATELTLATVAGWGIDWSADNAEVVNGEPFPAIGAMLLRVVSRLAKKPAVGGLNLARVAQFVDAGRLCGDRGVQTVWWDASGEPRDDVDQPQWAVKIGENFIGVVMGLRRAESRDALRDVSDWAPLLGGERGRRG